jgi:GrpB-like predicted nucleotidyltransferase (UPF0157 family)
VIEVVAYADTWPNDFARVADALTAALGPIAADIEHVGSTSVPGLCAKPIIDIDIIVERADVPAATRALERGGYKHLGNLGIEDRAAFKAPDQNPTRHVYVCVADTLNVRNHLAVRDVLRRRDDLRDEYAAVKRSLAADPSIDIDDYIARKSPVLQKVLALSDLTDTERSQIHALNNP